MTLPIEIMMKKYLTLLILMMLLPGCGGGGGFDSTPGTPSQGSRILGMDIKEIPSVTYDTAYNQAMAIGVREVKVSLDWAALEPTVGNYDNTVPGIIESYYPLQTGDIALVLRPLDTPGPSMPSDLAGLAFDDPKVITAFDNFLSNLHDQLPTLNASGKLRWINIGNEIDASLGSDTTKWSQWQSFFQAAKAKVNQLWGSSVQVSSIIEFSVLNDKAKLALYQDLLPDLDDAVLTYYPLNSDFTVLPVSTVASDFKLMVDTIPKKSIVLQECGYPSSADTNSSETLQADFISSVFNAWDTYSDRISLIDLSWQYDVSSSTVDQWVIDYGMSGNTNETAFRGYLGSLGLNNYDSTEKKAMQRLRDELLVRNWVN